MIASEAARLTEVRAETLEARIAADLALGQHASVIAELQRLVDEEPLREQLWAHLMLALYRSARQSDALAAYQQCRRRLDEEVGIEPHPSLRQLEAEILRQAPSLDWVPASARPRRRFARVPGRGREPAGLPAPAGHGSGHGGSRGRG